MTTSLSADVVALDGPAGSGKSTVARLVAERLGLRYLDTGAMYRAVTFGVLQRSIDPADVAGVGEVAAKVDIVFNVAAPPEDGPDRVPDRVIVDGVDATAAIRGPEVTAAVSAVSANPTVRSMLRGRQREWVAEFGSAVLEGRDIGTVIFPDARLKVYLDARAEVRAARRATQSGEDEAAVLASILARDQADSSRKDSPLATAADAVVIDTSELAVDEVVDAIAKAWSEAGG